MTFGKKTTALEVVSGRSLAGQQAIVTGAASGIGTETARALATAGANVVLAVRNVEAGAQVAAKLRAELPASAGALEVQPLDLSDLTSVRAFVDRWKQHRKPLQLLINNAGVMATPEGTTRQGFELQLGTNHLGHFALTTGLLPVLEASGAARIVTVSSDLHRSGDPQRLLSKLDKQPVKYARWAAYGDSKLANVLFAKGLAARLPRHVLAFSLHPGVIPTNLSRHMGVGAFVFNTLGRLFMKTVAQGAATSVYAATAPGLEGQSGAYLSDCHVATPAAPGLDAALAQTVWAKSEAAVA